MIINFQIHPYLGKQLHLGTKISTNMIEQLQEEIHIPPILNHWQKIRTLNKYPHKLVYCTSRKGASTITTDQLHLWSTSITAQELPTGQNMKLIVKWPNSVFIRGCVHTS